MSCGIASRDELTPHVSRRAEQSTVFLCTSRCAVSLTHAASHAQPTSQDVGHSKQAKEMLKKYYIGEYAGGESAKPKSTKGVVTR